MRKHVGHRRELVRMVGIRVCSAHTREHQVINMICMGDLCHNNTNAGFCGMA